jgi:cold shock CspA family protein
MQTGYISRLGSRGFGFIEPADGGPDIFFNFRQCRLRDQDLQVGDRVCFELNQLGKDRRAVEVRVL